MSDDKKNPRKKNDLTAFQAGHEGQLKTATKKTRGRPKVANVLNHKIQLSFSDEEMKVIEKKAGLVPLATYLKAELKDKGVI